MPNIGPVELIIILVIALLILGPGKLPDVGSALGKSIREFRKAASDVEDAVKLDATPAAPAAPAAAPASEAIPVIPVPNTLAAAAEPNVLTAAPPAAPAAVAVPAEVAVPVPATEAAAAVPVASSPEAKA